MILNANFSPISFLFRVFLLKFSRKIWYVICTPEFLSCKLNLSAQCVGDSISECQTLISNRIDSFLLFISFLLVEWLEHTSKEMMYIRGHSESPGPAQADFPFGPSRWVVERRIKIISSLPIYPHPLPTPPILIDPAIPPSR
jgi:hypothetical protein